MFEPLAAFIITMLTAPLMIKLGKSLGISGIDVHKPWKPLIPKTGGLAMVIGSVSAFLIHAFFGGGVEEASLISACLIASAIGLIEDIRGEINPKLKPLLLILCSIPILLTGVFIPRPVIPFLGKTRLYKVYPFMIVLSYPIVCNAANSVDVLNGSLISMSIPFFAVSAVIFYLRGNYQMLIFSTIFLASLIALIPFNRYPAKTFIGNAGSLFIGGAMVSIAIMGRVEIAAIIALLPHIMNEMHVIFSLGGIKSAKNAGRRPIHVTNDGLTSSTDERAPITLLRMLCAKTRVDEKSAVYAMAVVAVFASVLALITDLLFVEGAL